VLAIRWAPLARADIERMLRSHALHDTEAGIDIQDRILASARFLAAVPAAGPVSVRGDRRKWRVAGTKYILFYRITGDHIRILRVPHGAQDSTGVA